MAIYGYQRLILFIESPETIAFHAGIIIASKVVLNVINWATVPSTEPSGIRKEFRYVMDFSYIWNLKEDNL